MKLYNDQVKTEKLIEGMSILVTGIHSFETKNRFNGNQETHYVLECEGHHYYAPSSLNRYIARHPDVLMEGLVGKRVIAKTRVVNNVVSLYVETVE